jgi:RNase H-fold protein (predicted Holliday junction resolvase)
MTKSAENIEKKIEAQLEKLKQLKARNRLSKQEKKPRKRNRKKDDTRRKILLGSYFIKKMQK